MNNLIDFYRNETNFENLKKYLEISDLDITAHCKFVADIYQTHKIANSLYEHFYNGDFLDANSAYEYMKELIERNRSIINTLILFH